MRATRMTAPVSLSFKRLSCMGTEDWESSAC
jgi:hypothetical protein